MNSDANAMNSTAGTECSLNVPFGMPLRTSDAAACHAILPAAFESALMAEGVNHE